MQFRITSLRKWGHIKPGVDVLNGGYIWSIRGKRIAEVGYSVIMTGSPCIELCYKYREEPRNYRVYLETVPSNLGIGDIWYFQCPATGKHCRILNSIGGYFLHREAFRDVYYESQNRSKYMRYLDKTFGITFGTDKLYDEICSKHFTRYYRGKPTRRYQKIMNKLNKAERVDLQALERAISL